MISMAIRGVLILHVVSDNSGLLDWDSDVDHLHGMLSIVKNSKLFQVVCCLSIFACVHQKAAGEENPSITNV